MSEKINIDKFKKNNFQVPENYFETFPEKLRKRISQSETEIKNEKTIFHLNRKFAYAASIIMLISFSYLTFTLLQKPKTEQLNKTQIADLINENYIDIDDYYLYDYIIENKTISTNTKEDNSIKNYILDKIDEKTIYDNN